MICIEFILLSLRYYAYILAGIDIYDSFKLSFVQCSKSKANSKSNNESIESSNIYSIKSSHKNTNIYTNYALAATI